MSVNPTGAVPGTIATEETECLIASDRTEGTAVYTAKASASARCATS
jgi:hypothetical protein